MQSAHDILGVERSATRDEITSAYRRAAMRWHPDRNLDNAVEAKERFQEIEQAYRFLMKMKPQVTLAANSTAAAAAADVSEEAKQQQEAAARAAVEAWRRKNAEDRKRRSQYEHQRQQKTQARDAHIAKRDAKIKTLSAACIALLLGVQIYWVSPPPLDIAGLSLCVLLAIQLCPDRAKTYSGDVLAFLVRMGGKLYFIALVAWFLWQMMTNIVPA